MTVRYFTTPIYYVNDVPHIGHAYTSLATDTLTRWYRLCGDEVRFQTGTDEHGLKIEQAARKTGISPKEHADRYSAPFRKLWDFLDVVPDKFIRTTDADHEAVVCDIWRRMEAQGDIYLGKYEGWYSVGDEAYFTEDELVDGKSPSGHEVSWVVEPSYFFRMSKYGDRLLEFLNTHPDFVRPASRQNEIVSFVKQGLQDISISRTTFSWGIPVPDADGHVIYVWVDALTNYISGLGGPGAELYNKFWPHVTHLIGKDIIRFHAVYWPCILMSAGLPLPEHIFAHGWWRHDGEKMSKTKGNVVDPWKIAGKYGPDVFRYFVLREVSFGADGDFSEKGLCGRINGDLANGYGNLFNRTLGMLARYRNGVVPNPGEDENAAELKQRIAEVQRELSQAMDELAFHKALAAIWSVIAVADKYVDSSAPWTLAKNEKTDAAARQKLDAVLYNLCETLRILGVWTLAFLPRKAKALLDRLNVPEDLRNVASTLNFGAFKAGTTVQTEGEALFPRVEMPAENEATPAAPAAPAPAPKKAEKKAKKAEPEPPPAEIDFSDFAKLDLRVAKIIAAERHPDADRILKLTVDAGDPEPRTICSGIAEAYAPEDVVGRSVILVANLAPRKIRGIMSYGMLLCGGEGKTTTLATVPADLKPGTRVS